MVAFPRSETGIDAVPACNIAFEIETVLLLKTITEITIIQTVKPRKIAAGPASGNVISQTAGTSNMVAAVCQTLGSSRSK